MKCPNIFRIAALLSLGALACAVPALAQEYQSGHGALQIWDEAAQSAAPQWVQVWLIILIGSFALGLLFVWKRVIARWVVGGFIAMIGTMIILTGPLGLPSLSGMIALVHIIFWSPALYLLLTRRPFLKERSFYGAWSALITAVILFSFVFDVRDTAIYLDHILGTGLFA